MSLIPVAPTALTVTVEDGDTIVIQFKNKTELDDNILHTQTELRKLKNRYRQARYECPGYSETLSLRDIHGIF